MAFKSSPDKGKKPAVGNYISDGSGGRVSLDNDNDFDRGTRSDDLSPRVSVESARGGQSSPRPVFKAKEKSTKPVTSGGVRSTTGWVRPENTAKDPTIP